MIQLLQFLFVSLSLYLPKASCWPSGAPRCNIRPGHGSETEQNVTLNVTSLGDARWKVLVPVKLRGIVLNADKQGYWETLPSGFRLQSSANSDQGKCVTHSNSWQKSSGQEFVFVTEDEDGISEFSGFLARSKWSYSAVATNYMNLPTNGTCVCS